MRFQATLTLAGKTATGIQVPDEVVAALGNGKRPAVRVTINGHTYRSTVASMGGVFMLPDSAEQRAGAGVQAGDDLEVDVELDTALREVTVPDDLATALAGDAEAKRFWDSLAYSHQLRHVLAVEGAKAPETRTRRIANTLEMMRAGRKQ